MGCVNTKNNIKINSNLNSKNSSYINIKYYNSNKINLFKNINEKDRWSHALTFTMTYNIVGTICVCLGAFYRYKIKNYESFDGNIEIPMKKNISSKSLLSDVNSTEEDV